MSIQLLLFTLRDLATSQKLSKPKRLQKSWYRTSRDLNLILAGLSTKMISRTIFHLTEETIVPHVRKSPPNSKQPAIKVSILKNIPTFRFKLVELTMFYNLK
jgi:hypothetical protein